MDELRRLWWTMEAAKAEAARATAAYNVAYIAAVRERGLSPDQALNIWAPEEPAGV